LKEGRVEGCCGETPDCDEQRGGGGKEEREEKEEGEKGGEGWSAGQRQQRRDSLFARKRSSFNIAMALVNSRET